MMFLRRSEPFVLLVSTFVALGVSAIGPYEWGTWWMEVAPVLIGIPVLLATYRRFPNNHSRDARFGKAPHPMYRRR